MLLYGAMRNPFLGVKEAYFAGQNGDALPKNANRLSRLAHSAGAVVCRYYDGENEALYAQQRAWLEEAVEAAQGHNRKALEILRDTEALPNVSGHLKGWSYGSTDNGTGVSYRKWRTSISYGPQADPDWYAPVVHPMGRLEIIAPGDAVPALTTDVERITIAVQVPLRPNSEDAAGPPEVRIKVNDTPYDPDKPLIDEPTFEGSAIIHTDGSGAVASLGLKLGNFSGYTDMNLALREPQLGPMLHGVHAAVLATQQAYQI